MTIDPVKSLREVLNTEAGILIKLRLQTIKQSLEEKAIHAARSQDIESIKAAIGQVDGIEIVLQDFERIRKGN